MYSFLEEMDYFTLTIIIILTVCSHSGKMPVLPSPVITSTRPKSTKLHQLPLNMVNYLLLFKLS